MEIVKFGVGTIDKSDSCDVGTVMYDLCQELWPLNRSLTGAGNRETLSILKREFPDLQINEVPSGTAAFDWTVPLEWDVREAWLKSPSGKMVADFSANNLHLVGYSTPVHLLLDLEDLQPFLHSLPSQPDAIPYVTSYYKQNWGFCISENDRCQLEPGTYEVFIDSKLFPGAMSFGEIFLPGLQESEILLSTYICHPSMANNELSGVAVSLQLAKYLHSLKNRQHSYRILFLPETIGAIYYLSRNLPHLQKNLVAGYVVTCVGDNRAYSYVPSRMGDSYADRVARHSLQSLGPQVSFFGWEDRQSDERQYSAPLVDLPVGSIMRSKYDSYPEYHTSLDTLGEVVTADGLAGGYQAYLEVLKIMESDFFPLTTNYCEPQLGKRNLYPSLSKKGVYNDVKVIRDLLSWADGTMTLLEISQRTGHEFWALVRSSATLLETGLIEKKASTGAKPHS